MAVRPGAANGVLCQVKKKEARVFGNPDFGKKSRFENKLAVFRKVLKV